MERYIELVKQYPGQEQVDPTVEIEVPGSWFCVGSLGLRGKIQGGLVNFSLNKKTHTVSALELHCD